MSHRIPEQPDALDRLVARLVDQTTPPGPDVIVKDQLLAKLAAGATIEPVDEDVLSVSPNVPLKRDNTMTRFLATLAAGLAAVCGYLLLSASGGPDPGAAFAAMVQQMQEIRTAKFKQKITSPLGPEVIVTATVKEPGWMRQTAQSGTDGEFVQIFHLSEQKALSLFPKLKRAMVIEMKTDNPPRNVDVIATFRELADNDAVYLGEEAVAGVTALKYSSNKGGDYWQIWIDPVTNLPVKCVATDAPADKHPTTVMTIEDFQWNVDVDDSQFSLEIPAGYAVDEQKLDLAQSDVAAFSKLLRLVAVLNDEQFPEELNILSIVSLVQEKLAKPNGPPETQLRRTQELIAKALDRPDVVGMTEEQYKEFALKDFSPLFGHGAAFMEKTKKDNEWHYVGVGVKLGDADAIVVWWAPNAEQGAQPRDDVEPSAGERTAAVMFGDFHCEQRPVAGLPREEPSSPDDKR